MNRGPNICMEIAIHMLLYLNDSTSNFIPACFFFSQSIRKYSLVNIAVLGCHNRIAFVLFNCFSQSVFVFVFLASQISIVRWCWKWVHSEIRNFQLKIQEFIEFNFAEQWTRNSQRKQCVDDIINSFVSNSTHFNAHERNLWRLIQLNRRNFSLSFCSFEIVSSWRCVNLVRGFVFRAYTVQSKCLSDVPESQCWAQFFRHTCEHIFLSFTFRYHNWQWHAKSACNCIYSNRMTRAKSRNKRKLRINN